RGCRPRGRDRRGLRDTAATATARAARRRDRGGRVNVHAALVEPLRRLAGVLEGAQSERRDGYTFLAYPTYPVRDLNGMWVDSDAALAHIGDARAEAAELGTPFSIMVREGRSTAVEAAARELGFEPAVRIPGMAVTPDD